MLATRPECSTPSPAGCTTGPTAATLVVFYDDLGQQVPPPGLVRLGVVDSGLDAVASAGNRFTVRIDLVDGAGS